MVKPRPIDIFFGKLVRWLDQYDLEMHTPIRGETYICKRRRKRPRTPSPEGQP